MNEDLESFFKKVISNHEAVVKAGYPEDYKFKVEIMPEDLEAIKARLKAFEMVKGQQDCGHSVGAIIERLSEFSLESRLGFYVGEYGKYCYIERIRRYGSGVFMTLEPTDYED